MGPESFYPASAPIKRLGVVGMQKVPRAMVKQTIHSGMEVDTDPKAKELEGVPLLKLSMEIDIGEARMMFPSAWDKIQEGAADSTSTIADYERLRREETYAMGTAYITDTNQQRPTFTQVWVQPMAYNRTGKKDYAARMKAAAPDGIKLTLLGAECVGIKKAVLTKEWTLGRLRENEGIYCQSIAQNVVSFNERFNSAMQLYDDYMMRAACGLNLIDGSRIDSEKWKGNTLAPATVMPVPMSSKNGNRPLADAFMHFDIPINPSLGVYPSMLLNMAQMMNGISAQITGNGTQQNVDTLGGQQLQVAATNTGMAPFWENVKEEHALAAQNAIECLQTLLKCGAAQEIWEVVEDKGSQFRNNYVNLQKMQGRVKVYPDEDQDLPMTPEQIRESFTLIITELSKGNPVASAIMDVPANQDMIGSTLWPNLVSPVNAQRAKTLQDLGILQEQTATPFLKPDGSVGSKLPVEPSIWENFKVGLATTEEFLIENSDLRIKNPVAFSQFEQYYGMQQDMQMQQESRKAALGLKVQQAGVPAPQPPDPQMQAQQEQVRQLALSALSLLETIGQMPPEETGGTVTGQVAALREVVETGYKTEKLVATGK